MCMMSPHVEIAIYQVSNFELYERAHKDDI